MGIGLSCIIQGICSTININLDVKPLPGGNAEIANAWGLLTNVLVNVTLDWQARANANIDFEVKRSRAAACKPQPVRIFRFRRSGLLVHNYLYMFDVRGSAI